MDGDSPIPILASAVFADARGALPFYIILFALLIIGGAYFAGAEIALASVNKIRMMSYAENGDKRAKRVLYIHDHFDKALSTLLIGNNIMHIACATISTVVAKSLWGESAVTYSTIVVTLIVFFISETLPKYYAKACNEKFALAISGSLVFLMKLLTPLSFIFTQLSKKVNKPFADAAEEELTVTEDELLDIIETGIEEGAIDEEKGDLMQSAFEFSQTRVSDILTPWSKVLAVGSSADNDEILRIICDNIHSRIPVVNPGGGIDGILNIRRFMRTYMKDPSKQIKLDSSIISKPYYVVPTMPVDELLPKMSEARTHIAIVSNDNKIPLGIITIEDMLEELVGEIYDEDDPGEVQGVIK